MRHWIWIVLVLAAACVTLTPEQKLSHELFVEAAHECQSRYHTIHVDQIDLDGSLKIHADAESRTEYRPYVACYHEALKSRAEARRKAGLPVPDTLLHEHDVELD
jgi:hypothetical protein